MIQSSSAGNAKSYFSDALQHTDYYINDQELPGRFLGHLAERIGVKGPTTKEDFFALCENINPQTGKALTPRTYDNRRIGYDINFHCPKSVSIVNALSNDDHIVKAFRASVFETMQDIEADSMTRVRKRGAYEDRKTGELLWSDFTHLTARPVDGSTPDPHLHSHCFVFNATWDDIEKEIKAGQFGEVKRDMPYYEARFHKRLSDKLIDLGYQVRRTNKFFEIEGVPESVINLFSKRSNAIGEFAKENGITDAKGLDGLGAKTRSKKQKGLSMDELKTEWRRQIKADPKYEINYNDKKIRFAPKKEQSKEVATDCVDYALNHTFERASVMAERRILESAYRDSIGKRPIGLHQITNTFLNDARIIRVKEKSRTFCTTKAVLAEEKKMVELVWQGQGRMRPLYKDVPAYSKLTDQQNNAIDHVLTTPNQVSIIRGAAGAGKTRLMSTVVPLIEMMGKQVFVVAPSADASRGVLVSEGFKDANTVAKLLVDKEMQDNLYNQVLWVDEAGLLGTQDMTALLAIAKEQNARLILGGDTKQHTSVTRGDALRILNTVGGIKAAEVNKIQRQRNVHYKAAVEDLSKGDVKAAFIKLSSIGAIHNIDPLDGNKDLIQEYVATVKKEKAL